MATSEPLVKRAGTTCYVTIPLAPVPAARPRVGRFGSYYPKGYATWKDAADELLRPHAVETPDEHPVQVFVEVICKMPKSPANSYPRADIDNYVKAALDAITKSGVYWKDDVQIVSLHAIKRYTRLKGEAPHTMVAIYHSSDKVHETWNT